MFEKLLPPGRSRVVTSDRYAVYERVEAACRQCCWAHLKRNFQALVDLGSPTGRAVGNWALAEIRKLFHVWHRFQRGEIDRGDLQAGLAPVQESFRALLAMGSAGTCRKTATLCQDLEKWWESLWTFARLEGVEPTNNAAERALRGAVLWRKSSFGHQSEGGREFVETMLTVCGSLRLQDRPALPFVRAACEARLRGATGPSLLRDVGSPP
jgi:transposase